VFQHQGIWLPDGEKHLTGMLDRGPFIDGIGTYQYKKYKAVLSVTPNRKLVIDVGAHVGLWSMHFVRDFLFVAAFEPILAHRECYMKNIDTFHQEGTVHNFMLYSAACGAKEAKVRMKIDPNSSGDTFPNPSPYSIEGTLVEMVRIDKFNFEDVNIIKLDCEGYELFALQGAEETIKRNKPTIIVEQKPGRAQKFGLGETEAVPYLEGLGMTLFSVMSGDFIMVWE